MNSIFTALYFMVEESSVYLVWREIDIQYGKNVHIRVVLLGWIVYRAL